MKIETHNQGKCSVTFFKQSTGIPVPIPVSHKKVPFRILFLKSLCIPAGTNSYSGPWTTLVFSFLVRDSTAQCCQIGNICSRSRTKIKRLEPKFSIWNLVLYLEPK